MVIEIATEHSVFVELSAEDLRNMNLTYEELGAENAQTAAACRTILHEIRLRTGRTYTGEEVEIDLLPSRFGGCLMIVSEAEQKSTKQKEPLLCLLEDEDALIDLLRALKNRDAISSLELLQWNGKGYAVLAMEGDVSRHEMREFGRLFRLSKLQLASIREQSERLKVFGRA